MANPKQVIVALATKKAWGQVVYIDKYLRGELKSQQEYVKVGTLGTEQEERISLTYFERLPKAERAQYEKVPTIKTRKDLYNALNCNRNNFARMLMIYFKLFNCKHKVKAYEFVQSFSANDDVTPERAHQLGMELVQKYFKDFPVLMTTHVDSNNIHNQFVIGNINIKTGKYCQISPSFLDKMKKFGGRQCAREGFNESIGWSQKQDQKKEVDYENGQKKQTRQERLLEKQIEKEIKQDSKKSASYYKEELESVLRNYIREVQESNPKDEKAAWNLLERKLKSDGIILNYSQNAKYYSVMHPQINRAVRGHTLNVELTKENVSSMMLGKREQTIEKKEVTQESKTKKNGKEYYKGELRDRLKECIRTVQMNKPKSENEAWSMLEKELSKYHIKLNYSPNAKYYSVTHPKMSQACRGHNLDKGLAKSEVTHALMGQPIERELKKQISAERINEIKDIVKDFDKRLEQKAIERYENVTEIKKSNYELEKSETELGYQLSDNNKVIDRKEILVQKLSESIKQIKARLQGNNAERSVSNLHNELESRSRDKNDEERG